MKESDSNTLDLSVDSETLRIFVEGGPTSIQPIIENLVGNPTYTLEVSNDDSDTAEGGTYTCFNRTTTNIAIDTPIQIAYGYLPWKYMRLKVTTDVGVTGSVKFKILQGQGQR